MSDESLDLASLRTFLAAHLDPVDELEITGEGGGYSNETLFLDYGGRELVIRRPPTDETAGSAHDVLREYEILEALQGTDVPVPTTVAACEDHDVLGSEFYVMDRLDGEVIHSTEPERFKTPRGRRRLGEEFVDSLAAVHTVDYDAVGLGDLGRPDGYLERQVGIFSDSIKWAFETTAEEREVPELYEVMDWLAANVPDEATDTLVHGDYKLDNVMFGRDALPSIIGVLDWEMSTLGDPLADLGFVLQFWPDPSDDVDLRATQERFAPSFLAHPDYLTREEFVERYERRTGIQFVNRRFYVALAAFKMATVAEMFFARYLRGGIDDPMYRAFGETVRPKGRLALAAIEGEWSV